MFMDVFCGRFKCKKKGRKQIVNISETESYERLLIQLHPQFSLNFTRPLPESAS